MEKLGLSAEEARGGCGPLVQYISAIVCKYDIIYSKLSKIGKPLNQIKAGQLSYSFGSINSRNSCKMLSAVASLSFDQALKQGFEQLATTVKHNLARVMFSGALLSQTICPHLLSQTICPHFTSLLNIKY